MIKKQHESQLIAAQAALSKQICVSSLPSGEYFNVLSHLIGSATCLCIALAVASMVLVVDAPAGAIGLSVYAISASIGFFCSALFHAAADDRKRELRRYDRASIFLALGGFHTANITAIRPDAPWWSLLPVWLLLIFVIRIELKTYSVKTGIWSYLLFGWGGCFLWLPSSFVLPDFTLGLEACDALAISLGALGYRMDSLPRNHQIWHFLVVLGSLSQMVALAQANLI